MLDRRHAIFAVLLSVMMIFAGVAGAATPSLGFAVEDLAATADAVYTGRIVSVSTSVTFPATHPVQGWETIAVAVDETLKGTPVDHVSFYTILPASCFPQHGVFFVWPAGRYFQARQPPVGFKGADRWGEAINLDFTSSQGVINTDLKNGLSPARVLKLIRDHCQSGLISPSQTVLSPLGYSDGWPALMIVPVDPPMQALARQWAASDDDTLAWNAILILSRVQSPANIAVFQKIACRRADTGRSVFARAVAIDQLRRWKQIPPPTADGAAACKAIGSIVLPMLLAFFIVLILKVRFGVQLLPNGLLLWTMLCIMGVVTISFFRASGFVVGFLESGVWRGQIILIYRWHALISPSRFHLEGTEGLPMVSKVRTHWLPQWFADGGTGYLEPYWSDLHGAAFPLWILLGLIPLCALLHRGYRVWRCRSENRRRGFPVSGE